MSSNERVAPLLSAGVILCLVAGYMLSSKVVTITVDDKRATVRTHRMSVADLLAEIGLALADDDIVDPSLSSLLTGDDTVRVARAQTVTLKVDNQITERRSHATTAAALLREAGVQLHGRDQVFVNDRPVDPNSALLAPPTAAAIGVSLAVFLPPVPEALGAPRRSAIADRPSPVTIEVLRAVAVELNQDGTRTLITTAAKTVGDALFAEGIYIYSADIVLPALDAPVSAEMNVSIRRARLATITADGRTFSTRTQASTVAALLVEEGVPPQGKDYSTPDLATQVTSGIGIRLTRVREETVTESEGIPFKTAYQADGNLELDQRAVIIQGKHGVRKRTTRIVYEDGKEVQRTLDREWVDEEPTTQVVAYGTRVVVRTGSTPDGPIEYWREIRVWAAFYTPLTSGTPLSAPWFGITRTGLRATKGVIAVDPTAIRLHTPMYVPGYGFGAAEDTGNLVLGMVIDLCYDDDDSHPERWQWARWTTAYLLTPAPTDIPWVLPDYPRERN